MKTGVIPIFRPRKEYRPHFGLLRTKATKVCFQHSIQNLSLTIRFWMIRCVHPQRRPCNNSFQKRLRNIESLSLTMEVGVPCNLTTSLINTFEIDLAEYGSLRGMK